MSICVYWPNFRIILPFASLIQKLSYLNLKLKVVLFWIKLKVKQILTSTRTGTVQLFCFPCGSNESESYWAWLRVNLILLLLREGWESKLLYGHLFIVSLQFTLPFCKPSLRIKSSFICVTLRDAFGSFFHCSSLNFFCLTTEFSILFFSPPRFICYGYALIFQSNFTEITIQIIQISKILFWHVRA